MVESLVIVDCGKDYQKITTLLLAKKLRQCAQNSGPSGSRTTLKKQVQGEELPGKMAQLNLACTWLYDKRKPFCFCIHGCIEGYSQRILWLEMGTTNKNPAKYFYRLKVHYEKKHLGLTIYPRRAEFRIRWRTRKTFCTVPKELAAHKSVSV